MRRKKSSDNAACGRNTGTVMVELNLFFLILLLGCGLFFNYGQTLLKNCARVLAEIELFQAARYSQTILKRELSYNAASIRLGKDLNNRDRLTCRKTSANVQTQWYVLNKTLYRKTTKGMSEGVNPFSEPRAAITGVAAERLAADRLKLSVVFTAPGSGISRSFSFVFLLSNGEIGGQMYE